MRVLLALLVLLAVATTVSAAQPLPVYVSHTEQLPNSFCGSCVGVGITAETVTPGCADCSDVGVHVGVQHDPSGTTVEAQVCRGGFVYICPVDQTLTV